MMKKFLLQYCIACLLFVALIFGVYIVLPYSPNGYNRAYEQKINLLQDTPSPRIVIVGGSNAAFGFDSQAIEDSLGIPVINVGLHAGVGLRFMLDDAERYLKAGDILIVSPEYEQFSDRTAEGGQPLADIILGMAPNKLPMLNHRQFWSVVNNFPAYIKSSIFSRLVDRVFPNRRTLYSLDAFNSHGDVSKHWNDSYKYQTINLPYISKVSLNQDFTGYFEAKIKSLELSGIRVFIFPPSVTSTTFANERLLVDTVDRIFEAQKLSFAFDNQSVVFADSLYLDTPYHLSYEGIRLKNRIVIDFFKNSIISK